MTSNTHLQIAYRLAIVLLVIGVLSYAAFPAKGPDTPVRLVYKTMAGKVYFDHKTHLADKGYGLACLDCHHHPTDDSDAALQIANCGTCHAKPEQMENTAKACNECHDSSDYDLSEMLVRADAFHNQCISCHKEFGKGPAACAGCHVL
ncbi:MAG: cytochrome c3 family protein [Pseudomonadota bacterium]